MMNQFNPQLHQRRSIRLHDFDYSQAGAYFVTCVAHGRECLFGQVTNEEVILNRFGQIVKNAWFELPKHYRHVELDALCIMPNHIHAIIVLNEKDVVKRQPLSEVVRAFKSFSARKINEWRKLPGTAVWQRNYYEHIIRNNEDYLAICGYIQNNPLNWEKDEEYL